MAVKSRRSKIFNKIFEEREINASYVPMNVREDDIFFTISNLKDSQLKGVNIGIMYKKEVCNHLKENTSFASISDEAKIVNFVDSVKIQDSKLYGFVTVGEALVKTLEQNNFNSESKIAILGSGSLTKSLILNLKKMGIKNITLAKNSIESIPKMLEEISEFTEDINFEIERVAEFMPLNGSKYDLIINATPFGQFAHDEFTFIKEMNSNLTLLDFKESESGSFFKKLADENQVKYIGRDEIAQNSSEIDLKVWLS